MLKDIVQTVLVIDGLVLTSAGMVALMDHTPLVVDIALGFTASTLMVGAMALVWFAVRAVKK